MTLVHCLECAELIRPDLDECPSCHARQDRAHLSFSDPGTLWRSVEDRLRAATADKYEVQGLLGYGGMAAVFLARDPKLDRRVAIKVMSPALMAGGSMVDRFMTEATATARLNHPNIVTIFDVDERDGLHYFAMSYVAGRSMDSLIEEEGRLDVEVTRYWIAQIAEALAYAHGKGVVHRDIKPGNILLDEEGQALVADFGIAKVAGQEGLTRYGAIVGTPAYISPEQFREDRASPRSDQYALGVVAYEMLAGVPPIRGSAHSITAAHVVGTDPPPLGEVRPDCPDDLTEAIHRMLSRDPSERWPSLHDLVRALGPGPADRADPLFATLKGLVRGREASSLDVSPLPDVLVEGEEREIRLRAMDRTGEVIRGRRVMVRTTDPSIVTISGEGIVKARKAGTVDIVARSGAVSVAMPLQVIAAPVQSVRVSPSTITFPPTGSVKFEASVIGPEGRALDGRTVSWRVTDPDVARIGYDGVVEPVAAGSTEVVASCDGVEGTAALVIPESSLEARGARDHAPAEIVDERPGPPSDVASDGAIEDRTVLIDGPGTRPLGNDPPPISRPARSASPRAGRTPARSSRTRVSRRKWWAVAILLLAVGSVAMWPLLQGQRSSSPATSNAREDDTERRLEPPSGPDGVTSMPSPEPGSEQASSAPSPGGPSSEQTPSSASVDAPAEGSAEGDTPGIVEAPSTPAVTRVVLSAGDDTVRIGDRVALTASASTADGAPVRSQAVWSVSDPSLARIERDGAGHVIVGIAPGRVRVEAEVDGVTGGMSLDVVEEVTALSLSPGNGRIKVGDTMRIEVFDQIGRSTDASFHSSDPGVAFVSEDGFLAGVSPGTVTVTATAVGLRADAEYTVEPAEPDTDAESEEPAPDMKMMTDPDSVYGPLEITELPVLMNEDEYARAVNEAYPQFLREVGVGGAVRLELRIDRDGTVREARVVEPGSSREALEAAAVVIGRGLRFRPARRFGEAVATSGFEFVVEFDPGT